MTSGLNKVNPEKNFGEYIFSEKWPKTDQCGLKGSKISKIDQFNELKSSYEIFLKWLEGVYLAELTYIHDDIFWKLKAYEKKWKCLFVDLSLILRKGTSQIIFDQYRKVNFFKL